MITDKLAKALAEQVGHELAASNAYLGIAVYFSNESLDKWSRLFHKQSDEEREHALKITTFLSDVAAPFDIPAVPKSKCKYPSALEAVQWALENEKQVTRQFHSMAEAALAQKDYTVFQFLQWFLEEQVEEESLMQELVDLLKSGVNPFRAESLLPEHG